LRRLGFTVVRKGEAAAESVRPRPEGTARGRAQAVACQRSGPEWFPRCKGREEVRRHVRTEGGRPERWVRRRPLLQAKVVETRVVIRAAAQWPMVLPLGLTDRQVVDAGNTPSHKPVRVKLPVFISVGPKPVARVVVPLVGEPNSDAVVGERPQFFDEPVIEFLVPLSSEELHNGGSSLKKLRAVPPNGVRGVG
jgi:hypothetical protein